MTELTTERLEEIAANGCGGCAMNRPGVTCVHVLARALLAMTAERDDPQRWKDTHSLKANIRTRAESAEAERDAALARVGELEAALLPFAKAHVSAAHRDDPLDLHSLTNLRHPATHVSAADFKRASAALTPPEDPPA